jgi:N6-L-threonylcarbamoyladenine synthase
MVILAVETSCDETSIAISKDKEILSNVTISQILDHSKYGGVMPSLAARLHLKNIQKVLFTALSNAKLKIDDINYVAYTEKPGLIICLQIGKIIAETISLFLNVPLIPCNHLLGHSYASLLNKESEWVFPALSLIVSGGHTQFYKIENHSDFEIIGQTLDDAVGECLDKAAVIMGYDYPGGPIIENLSLKGKRNYKLPFPKNDKSLDFSFSGLKSEIKRISLKEGVLLNHNDLSFSLQESLLDIFIKKINLALNKVKPKTIIIGGGVISNKLFRKTFVSTVEKFDSKIKTFIPDIEYSTDNAAMIAILAYYQIKNSLK